jgi:DNA-binding NarL/FixJ family response regulator
MHAGRPLPEPAPAQPVERPGPAAGVRLGQRGGAAGATGGTDGAVASVGGTARNAVGRAGNADGAAGSADGAARAAGSADRAAGAAGSTDRRRPLRILVVDAAPMQRAGLRMALAGAGGGSPARTTATAAGTTASGAENGGTAAETTATAAETTATAAETTATAAETTATAAETTATAAETTATAAGITASAPRTGGSAAGVGGVGAGDPAGTEAEIVVVGEVGDGAEAVDLARRLLPDVLITDIALPRLDGLAVTRAVAGLPVRVLVVTAQLEDEQVLSAIAAGAAGFLSKDVPAGELIAAVRAVAAGGAVIAPRVLARILPRVAEALPAPQSTTTSALDALTEREREVLIHVARGHSNGEIARVLLVSETTIKTHVGHVLTKLRLRDRTQAVILAYETGLLKPGA